MNLTETLREQAFELGADLCKVAAVSGFSDAPSGHHPRDTVSAGQSIIVLGMKYLDAQVNILPDGREGSFFTTSPRQEMYAGHNGLIAHELDVIGLKLARFLERQGFRAYHQMASQGGVDNRFLTSILSLKHMAVNAGIGVFGYNALVLTPKYGPRVRLGAIITNAALEADEPLTTDFCTACTGTPCITLCPAKALSTPARGQPYHIDKFACSTYLRTRPACAICMKVCPIGTRAR